MRLTVSLLKEMIHDEIVKVALDEQRSASSSGGITTYAGEFGVPDPGSKALADEDITTAMSQEDQSLVQGLDEDDDEDPTDPAVQAKRKNVAATKVRQERERAAAVGLVSVPSG